MDSPKVVAARLEAARARERLMNSAQLLQHRAAPARLASDALETARERGVALFGQASDATRRRPALVAGIVLVTCAVLARHRIGRIFSKPKNVILPGPSPRALPRPIGDRK